MHYYNLHDPTGKVIHTWSVAKKAKEWLSQPGHKASRMKDSQEAWLCEQCGNLTIRTPHTCYTCERKRKHLPKCPHCGQVLPKRMRA